MFAFGAQSLHLVQSVIMSLLIPKLLDVEQFGFWQLFIFYSQYGGLLHFGMIDGIYLKEGGKEYEKLDYNKLCAQLKLLSVWLCVIMIPFVMYGLQNTDANRSIVIIASAIYVIIYNISTLYSYILQCVNDIKSFSIGRTIDMLFFVVALLVLLVAKVKVFVPYIIVYTIAKIAALVYYGIKEKELLSPLFSKIRKSDFLELFDNVKVGSSLMISNIASMLIIGFGRFLVDENWGIKAFSKVSFMLVFINFFMLFINQASLVLYPDLRKKDSDQIVNIYSKIQNGLYLMTPIILLSYMPFSLFIKIWLPAYYESTTYLLMLLPLCSYEAKMQLLYNTMFKVVRKERKLLICNLITLTVSIVTISISVYLLKDIYAVIVSMLLSVIVRNFIADYMLTPHITGRQDAILKRNCKEMSFIAIFVLANMLTNIYVAAVIYILLSIMILCSDKEKINNVIKRV